jgi:hypothetical protein
MEHCRNQTTKCRRHWRPLGSNVNVKEGEFGRTNPNCDHLQTVVVIDKEQSNARAEEVLALQLHIGAPMLVQLKDIWLKRFI